MSSKKCEDIVSRAIVMADPRAELRIDRSSGRVQVNTSEKIGRIKQAIEMEGYLVERVTA
ncbi:MAG: heavy metal transport/detoxification protein [Pseudomonadota bacterium]